MEKWKEVDGYDGYYEVSNKGRIRSWKNNRWGKTNTPKAMKLSKVTGGYMGCNLSKNSNQKVYKVSRLVAKAFIPNPKNKPQVNHINGIKTDDRVENLEWVTQSENTLHAYEIGLQSPSENQKRAVSISNRGENQHNSKLAKKDVKKIRKEYSSGKYLQKELAKEYNTTTANINCIVNRKTWNHI